MITALCVLVAGIQERVPDLKTARRALAFLETEQTHLLPAESVEVGGIKGFRLVFRTIYRFQQAPPQRPVATTPENSREKESDDEILLFPGSSKILDAKKLPWQKLPHLYKTRQAFWGTGYGINWYGSSTYFFQSSTRKQLKLVGGEDPLKLAVEAFSIQGEGDPTAATMEYELILAKDRALPYLEPLLHTNKRSRDARAIGVLAAIHTQKSIQRLIWLYRTVDLDTKTEIGCNLARKPYPAAAKNIFIDLIRRGVEFDQVIEASRSLRLHEATTALLRIAETTSNPYSARCAYAASRDLAGNPISPQAEAAFRALDEGRYDLHATKVLLACTDTKYKAYTGATLINKDGKGGPPASSKAGAQILDSLPQSVRSSVLARFRLERQFAAIVNRSNTAGAS